MFLVRLSLRNPYAVIVLALSIVLIGGTVLSRIPTDLVPQFRTPAVQIVTFYPGMPAETVERDMTTRLERWTGQSVGIEHQEAKSMLGVSIVKDFFREDIDSNSAMSQVTSYAMSDLYYLPPGTIPPMVMPFDPTASLPLCLLSVKSDIYGETELYDIAYFQLRNRLQSISGVIAPAVYGGKLRRILAYVDPAKLQARSLSPTDVVTALNNYNVFIPVGSARLGPTEYQLESNAMVPKVADLNNFPIRMIGHRPVFLKDIGYAEDSAELQSNIVRVGGKRQLYVPIYRQPGANTIRVVEGIKAAIPELNKRLPTGIKLDVVFDQSVVVRNAIKNLAQEGLLGGLLAILMIIVFLQSIRSTFVITLTLPICLLFSIAAIYFTGHSINVMTLGGLAIAVGLLIDQSIVVLENIERHLEMGKLPPQAALDGASEVASPLLVIVAGTCIVFLPVVFLGGIAKFLFTPLALAVTFALAASYVIALTVVPACAAKFLSAHAHRERISAQPSSLLGYLKHSFERIQHVYVFTLKRCLLHRKLVLGIVGIVFALSLGLYPFIGTELFPQVDSGQFTIRVRANTGTTVNETEKLLARVESKVKESIGESNIAEMITNIGVLNDWPAAYTPNSGPHDAFILVQLNANSHLDDETMKSRLRQMLPKTFPGIEFAFEPNSMLRAALNFGLPAPINIQVQGNDLHVSYAIAQELKKRIRSVPGTVDVRIQQRLDYPRYRIDTNRIRAAQVGLTEDEIVKNVVTAFNSSVSFAKSFWIDEKNGNHYWIGAQYPEKAFVDVNTILDVPVTGKNQPMPVMLRNLVTLSRDTAPSEVMHYNINRVIDIYSDVHGRDLGTIMKDIKRAILSVEQSGLVPSGYSIVTRGEYKSMNDSFSNLGFGLLFASILVYLVLVVQFQSLSDPLIVMLAIPLGLTGVFFVLFVTGTTLNIQSLMGVMMMIGIVKSFSLLMVDFAKERQAAGASPEEAIMEAATVRLRPILMTALAAVLGLVPMAIVGGANIPLARAVIGGVIASTGLSLYVVPIFYVLLHRHNSKGILKELR